MQITLNTTGLLAELCCAADQHAVDHAVVVIKGTFSADANGKLTLDGEHTKASVRGPISPRAEQCLVESMNSWVIDRAGKGRALVRLTAREWVTE